MYTETDLGSGANNCSGPLKHRPGAQTQRL